MISALVRNNDLESETIALAAHLAQRPSAAYPVLHKLARDAEQAPLAEALAAERRAQTLAGRTEDFKSGVMAFIQKRPPTFEGN